MLDPHEPTDDLGSLTLNLCRLMLDLPESRNEQVECHTQSVPTQGGCHDSSEHPYPHLICLGTNVSHKALLIRYTKCHAEMIVQVTMMNYELGLQALKSRLPQAVLNDFHVFEARLHDNLRDQQLYGPSDDLRSSKARILDGLNRLAVSFLGVSFNELCEQGEPSTSQLTKNYQAASANVLNAPNPFGVTGRITNPADFFDREDLLNRIFNELKKGCSLSLVGESQIGKSSILSMVCVRGPEHLKLADDACVYLDMRSILDTNDFFDALCDKLGITPVCRGYRLARELRLRGKRYILCLDKIDKLAKDRFTGDEQEELRGLADGPDMPLKLVMASRLPLDQVLMALKLYDASHDQELALEEPDEAPFLERNPYLAFDRFLDSNAYFGGLWRQAEMSEPAGQVTVLQALCGSPLSLNLSSRPVSAAIRLALRLRLCNATT
jgi:hypothetical protein